MIVLKCIPWEPMATMPEDRKDGRRLLGYLDPGPCTMAWNDGKYGGAVGWQLSPHWYEEAPIEPTHWADITPPV